MNGDPFPGGQSSSEIFFLSIVITAFNNEEVVGSAMKSAIQQTWGNVEIIVIDDGSTDKTAQVIRNIDPGDRVVRYHYQENKGIALARNQALSLVSGTYFAFLDADDLLAPDFAETLYRHHVNSSMTADLFILDYYEEKRQGELTPVHFDPHLLHHYERDPSDAALMIADRFASVWAKVYRTAFVTKNELRFYPSKTLEDLFFILDLLACRPVIVHAPVCAYYYLYNKGSLSRNLDLATFENRENAVRHYLMKYLSFKETKHFISFFSNRILMQFVLSFSMNVNKTQRKAIFYRTMPFLQEAIGLLETAAGTAHLKYRMYNKKTRLVYIFYCLIRQVYRVSRSLSYFIIRTLGVLYQYRK